VQAGRRLGTLDTSPQLWRGTLGGAEGVSSPTSGVTGENGWPSPAIDTAGTSGTPAYMAPEHWSGRDLTGAADIWAFGVILYQLLVGHRPYAGSGILEEARQVRLSNPVAAPELPRTVPDDVKSLMMGCLEKDSRLRPSAAQAKSVLDGPRDDHHSLKGKEESPFRGLLPFNENHHHMFFSREGEIGAFCSKACTRRWAASPAPWRPTRAVSSPA